MKETQTEVNKTFVRLSTGDIKLCAFRSDDEAISKYLEWLNNEEFAFYLGRNTSTLTWKAEEKFLEEDHELMFNICIFDNSIEKYILIGNCDIGTSNNTRNAMLGILIGEAEYLNKGYGTDVVKLLVKYCFEDLGKHNVALQVNSTNVRAIACYKKAGFVECGREKETNFHNGE